jgi:hypothetical protein
VKKAVAILLLIIFLFNVGGYYIVFWGLVNHSDKMLAARLDADQYSADELVELSIPLSLPYPGQQREFERAHGKFEHNGVHYKLVKQRHENDTLYVICIKDHGQKKLVKSMREYIKLTNDLPSSSKKSTDLTGKFLKDFESNDLEKIIQVNGWSVKIQSTEHPLLFPAEAVRVPSPPPEV